ncbi:GntR family transcriptional regulator [Anaerofustis stercorihominis]|uniref:GntR family transcriptional regulator n=1 Tax=Anaerofustis stercorihominis TaxID=214853 RepID=A0A3E3E1E3_9FIRM|nr:GntR family transcriptional regulator [Anaerofustis stercorihominis]MCQ4796392.1 GntR family transcriptional regulator [Anaerofustis stercorihominis]RGD75370.1 GntR family transcriptional regulator [Anaerofustis stercorihominis]
MDIIISNVDDKPIYEQIYTQIKNLIVSGKLKEGDPLPSIRSLAKDLRISVITTKRAYDELEKDGYVYTLKAKGSFVNKKDTKLIKEENLKKIEDYIKEIMVLAKVCDLDNEELLEMFKLMAEE